jgi:hypothetical protein
MNIILKILLYLSYFLLGNVFCNLNSKLNLSNFQIEEYDSQISRNLGTNDWILQNPCSQQLNYNFSLQKVMTRTNDLKTQEPYVFIDSNDIGSYEFNQMGNTIPNPITYKVKILNVSGGGIFTGMCATDLSAPTASCIDPTDVTYKIYFSGLAISYFEEDCYHIDHYVNNSYWTTPRHCLSEYELLNMTFSFQIAYDAKLGSNFGYLYITYDGFEYYNRSNIFVIADLTYTNAPVLTSVYPCSFLMVPGTSIKYVPSANYP